MPRLPFVPSANSDGPNRRRPRWPALVLLAAVLTAAVVLAGLTSSAPGSPLLAVLPRHWIQPLRAVGLDCPTFILRVGESMTCRPAAYYGDGVFMTPIPSNSDPVVARLMQVESTDSAVVRVGRANEVTALRPGVATLSTARESFQARVQVRVLPREEREPARAGGMK